MTYQSPRYIQIYPAPSISCEFCLHSNEGSVADISQVLGPCAMVKPTRSFFWIARLKPTCARV